MLPKQQARLLLPDSPTGRITINGRDYLYATQDERERRRRASSNSELGARREQAVLGRPRGCRRPRLPARRSGGRGACAQHRAAGAPSRTREQPAGGGSRSRAAAARRAAASCAASRSRSTRWPASSRAHAQAERSFLLSVSHELKTPLTAIRGYSEALDEGVLTPERAVKVIRTEAARLERLIADLINLARLDQQRFDIHPAHGRPRRDRARERDAARRAGTRPRRSNRARARTTERSRRADPDRLLQAVSESRRERAALHADRRHGHACRRHRGELTVKDTGPGIAPDEIPHAFDRFFLYRRYDGRPAGRHRARAGDRPRARAGDGR